MPIIRHGCHVSHASTQPVEQRSQQVVSRYLNLSHGQGTLANNVVSDTIAFLILQLSGLCNLG